VIFLHENGLDVTGTTSQIEGSRSPDSARQRHADHDLVREVPEAMEPRNIAVDASSGMEQIGSKKQAA
jgi:hypothetical protein